MSAAAQPVTNVKPRRRNNRINKQLNKIEHQIKQQEVPSRNGNRRRRRNAPPPRVRFTRASRVRSKTRGSSALRVRAGRHSFPSAGDCATCSFHDAYLASFLNPKCPARGPCDHDFATYPHTFMSTTELKFVETPAVDGQVSGLNEDLLDSGNVGAGPVLNGAFNNTAYQTGTAYMKNGECTIVAAPHFVRAQPNQLNTAYKNYTSYLVAGLTTVDPTTSHTLYATRSGNPGSFNTSSLANQDVPLQGFNANLPFDTAPGQQTLQAATWNATSFATDFAYNMPSHRTVGLRLTVEVNMPILTVGGQAYGGDNRSLYTERREDFDMTTTSQATGVASTLPVGRAAVVPPATSIFNSRLTSTSRCNIGKIGSGSAYTLDVCFKPSNNRIKEYIDETWQEAAAVMTAPYVGVALPTSTLVPPQPGRPFMTNWGSFVCNRPVAFIRLTGLPAGATARVGVDWAVEIVIDNNGPLALLVEAARFNPGFWVNWGAINGVIAAGYLGQPLANAAQVSGEIRNGLRGQAGSVATEVGRALNPNNYGIGAANQLPQAQSMIVSNGIMRPNDFMPTPNGWKSKVASGLMQAGATLFGEAVSAALPGAGMAARAAAQFAGRAVGNALIGPDMQVPLAIADTVDPYANFPAA
jgi:hypothetical protein